MKTLIALVVALIVAALVVGLMFGWKWVVIGVIGLFVLALVYEHTPLGRAFDWCFGIKDDERVLYWTRSHNG